MEGMWKVALEVQDLCMSKSDCRWNASSDLRKLRNERVAVARQRPFFMVRAPGYFSVALSRFSLSMAMVSIFGNRALSFVPNTAASPTTTSEDMAGS